MSSRKEFLKFAGIGVAGAIIPSQLFSFPQSAIALPSMKALSPEGKSVSPYRIVLRENPSDSEIWAATELQYWLAEISGYYVSFHQEKAPYIGKRIVIGYNHEISTITGLTEPSDNDESYHYFTHNENVYIYGGNLRGTMYGVFSFLENEFGCRWYTPRVTLIPKKPVLVFNECNYRENPGIRIRNNYYFDAFDVVWAARNKMNGRMKAFIPEHSHQQQPGGEETYWAVHTFFRLLPPAEFYTEHPEYYSLIDGKRIHERAQLCLSNPDVLNIMIERIRETILKYPQFAIYDVSQNNSINPCQCDDCQSIVKSEGADSGIIIWFVNQVAEAIEKEFPDKFIGTLAYRYTRAAPKYIRPRKNVVIRLCTNEACVAHTLDNCSDNASFMQDLQAWADISHHLYIWDYVVNFVHYLMPYPNFYVLQPNIQIFRDNKAIGIMEQAAYQSKGNDFQELRCFIISKLLWNPEINVEDVIDDFMYGYYGRSGRYVRAYFDLVHNLVKPDTRMRKGLDADDKLFTDEFVGSASNLLEHAARVADDVNILARVELTALAVLYLKCRRNPVLSRQDGTYQKLLYIIKREGVTHFAEYGETQESFMKFVEAAD